MTSPPVPCPCCAGTAWSDSIDKEGHRYVACDACGVVRLDPLPSAEAAAALYDEGYFTESTSGGYHDYLADEAIHRRNARRHLDRLERLGARPPGRLLEVGAAAGFLLDEARARGWEPVGVEIGPVAAHARDELGLTVHAELAAALRPDAPVDAVVMNQVLEHLTDPRATLEQVAEATAPGGVLTIETWDRHSAVARRLGARWQQVTPPSVLWLFADDDLRRLVSGAGFDEVEVRVATKWVSVATVLGQSAGGSGVVRRIAGSRLGSIGLPYRLGDLVVVTARRR